LEDVRELKEKISSKIEKGNNNFVLLLLFSTVYIFNQTFSLPGIFSIKQTGSVLMNLLAGTFLGLFKGK
jgi:hypothetical protein